MGEDFTPDDICSIFKLACIEFSDPHVPTDATKPLTFGTVENLCSVTVTSEETFTTAEWNTLVDKVVAAD
jgi:hypothetical protein